MTAIKKMELSATDQTSRLNLYQLSISLQELSCKRKSCLVDLHWLWGCMSLPSSSLPQDADGQWALLWAACHWLATRADQLNSVILSSLICKARVITVPAPTRLLQRGNRHRQCPALSIGWRSVVITNCYLYFMQEHLYKKSLSPQPRNLKPRDVLHNIPQILRAICGYQLWEHTKSLSK